MFKCAWLRINCQRVPDKHCIRVSFLCTTLNRLELINRIRISLLFELFNDYILSSDYVPTKSALNDKYSQWEVYVSLGCKLKSVPQKHTGVERVLVTSDRACLHSQNVYSKQIVLNYFFFRIILKKFSRFKEAWLDKLRLLNLAEYAIQPDDSLI